MRLNRKNLRKVRSEPTWPFLTSAICALRQNYLNDADGALPPIHDRHPFDSRHSWRAKIGKDVSIAPLLRRRAGCGWPHN